MSVVVFVLEQSLAAELDTLASELGSQGSEVTGVLGSGQLCVGQLGRLLPVVQTGLASREKQLQTQLEQTHQHQVRSTTSFIKEIYFESLCVCQSSQYLMSYLCLSISQVQILSPDPS